jgi:hypothetical protein
MEAKFAEIAKEGMVWRTRGVVVWLRAACAPDSKARCIPAGVFVRVIHVERNSGATPDRVLLQITDSKRAEQLKVSEVSIGDWPAELFYI